MCVHLPTTTTKAFRSPLRHERSEQGGRRQARGIIGDNAKTGVSICISTRKPTNEKNEKNLIERLRKKAPVEKEEVKQKRKRKAVGKENKRKKEAPAEKAEAKQKRKRKAGGKGNELKKEAPVEKEEVKQRRNDRVEKQGCSAFDAATRGKKANVVRMREGKTNRC